MADSNTIEAVGKGFDLYKDGPVAFAGFVGWMVAIWFIRLYVRQNRENRDITVQLLVTAKNLGDILERFEFRAPRRRKPTTNPGLKPVEPAE